METQKNYVCPKRGRESGCKEVKGNMREGEGVIPGVGKRV